MHTIIWDMGMVSMLTSDIDATEHKHWMLQLFYIPEGKMHLNVEGEALDGKLFIVNKNCIHSFRTENNLHFSMLITPGTQLCEHLTHAFLKDEPYYDFSNFVDSELSTCFDEFIKKVTEGSYRRFKEALEDVFSLEACQKSHENEERIAQIMQVFGKGDMDIESLADELALSPSRLAHLFKEETGTPLKSFIVLNKMFLAFQLLFSGKSITDAAMEAGFDSPSHFAATTKKMMGESPSRSLKDSDFLKVYSF